MDYSAVILELYKSVYEKQKNKFGVRVQDVRQAFLDMKEAYLPDPTWEHNFSNKDVANYNNAAHRCAYLHKYAMLHTGLVCEVLQMAFCQTKIFNDINSKKQLNLCSLGGGPGSDIVALLFVLKQMFGFIQCKVSVIDLAVEWHHVFESIVSELKTGKYGSVKEMVNSWYFSSEYLSADLLNLSYWNKYKLYSTLTNADIITMVKFMSAAACDKTRQMLRKIFQNMKVGAMLLFVDNAAGGFHKMLRQVASECGMDSVFGPVEHYEYEEKSFSQKLYGYTSQFKTKVVIEMWKKPSSYNTTNQLRQEFMYRGESSNPTPSGNVRLRANVQEPQDNECCSIV